MHLLLPLLLACAPQGSPDPAPASPETPAAEVPAPSADAAAVPNAPVMPGMLTEAEFAALHQLKGDAAPPARGQVITVIGQDVPPGSKAYMSLPEGAGPHPAVLVIHEWWGLNPHIQHAADRLAAAGFVVLAVDLYGGELATTRDEAMGLMKTVDDASARAILAAADNMLAQQNSRLSGKRAVLGWCFGGGWALQHALATPELDAAVMFYGRPVTEAAELASLQAPLLGIFGTQDEGIPEAAVDGFEAALSSAGKDARILRYDAPHAFANPSGEHYDAANAEKAWTEALAFLSEKLR